MKKRIFISICVLITLVMSAAAQESGIHFEQGLNWQQVLTRAKEENKHILVDCYATWCGPCKSMDKNVYPKDSVGAIINKDFICVKVQCDTSKNDDAKIQSWYPDASRLIATYQVSSYPSFLFFSPSGDIVHKASGARNPAGFVGLARDALDPHKQYYTNLNRYKEGTMPYKEMPGLARMARNIDDKEWVLKIATDYIHNYLDKLSDAAFNSKENFEFIENYYRANLTPSDRAFDWYLRRPIEVDAVTHEKGHSQKMANAVIYNSEVTPIIEASKKTAKSPDWSQLSHSIKSKYGESYVEQNVVLGKLKWYGFIKDFETYSSCVVEFIEKGGFLDSLGSGGFSMKGKFPDERNLNGCAWEIFVHSNDKKKLGKAVEWVDLCLKGIPKPGQSPYLDTKANLLYKMGKKEEALELEKQALALDPGDKKTEEAYKKMQEGKATWD